MMAKLPSGQFYGQALKRRTVSGITLTETKYSASLALPKHSHEGICFCLVLQGSFKQISARACVECTPATFLFCTPDETHADTFHAAGAHCFIIQPATEWLDRLRDCSPGFMVSAHFHGGPISWLAGKLFDEYRRMDDLSPLAIEGLALEIVAETARSGSHLSSRTPRRTPPRWLRMAEDILHEHFSETLTLHHVARTISVHPVHLARVFREFHGQTMGDYVRQLRIDFACRELSSTSAPLVDVALNAGFSSHGHFSSTFKRLTGLTPTEYRKVFARTLTRLKNDASV